MAGGGSVPWSRIRDSRYYLEEIMRRGDPDLRPAAGRIVIPRTAGMLVLESQFRGRSVFMTPECHRRVTPAQLLATLEQQCNVQSTAVKVELACPPFLYFVRFNSAEDLAGIV